MVWSVVWFITMEPTSLKLRRPGKGAKIPLTSIPPRGEEDRKNMRFCETNPIVMLANSVVTCSNVVSCDYGFENLNRVRLGKPNPFASKAASRRLLRKYDAPRLIGWRCPTRLRANGRKGFGTKRFGLRALESGKGSGRGERVDDLTAAAYLLAAGLENGENGRVDLNRLPASK